MGNLFQAKCWARHPRGCSFGRLWIRKFAKDLDMKNGSLGTFIYDNNGN